MTSPWKKFKHNADNVNTGYAPYNGDPVILLLHDCMLVAHWEPASVSNGPDGEDHDGFYWYNEHTGDITEWDSPIAWQPLIGSDEARAMQEAYRKEQWPN